MAAAWSRARPRAPAAARRADDGTPRSRGTQPRRTRGASAAIEVTGTRSARSAGGWLDRQLPGGADRLHVGGHAAVEQRHVDRRRPLPSPTATGTVAAVPQKRPPQEAHEGDGDCPRSPTSACGARCPSGYRVGSRRFPADATAELTKTHQSQTRRSCSSSRSDLQDRHAAGRADDRQYVAPRLRPTATCRAGHRSLPSTRPPKELHHVRETAIVAALATLAIPAGQRRDRAATTQTTPTTSTSSRAPSPAARTRSPRTSR